MLWPAVGCRGTLHTMSDDDLLPFLVPHNGFLTESIWLGLYLTHATLNNVKGSEAAE